MGAWAVVVGFSLISWGLLALGASGKLPSVVETLLGVLAVCSALIAGFAALGTWIYPVTGWIVGLHPVISLAAMGVALIAVGATVPVLAWDLRKWVPLLTGSWLILPSLLKLGVVPGTVGETMTSVVMEIAATLSANTAGWLR